MNRRDFLWLAGGLPLTAMAGSRGAAAQYASGKNIAAVAASPAAPEYMAGRKAAPEVRAPEFLHWLAMHAETLSRRPYAPPRAKASDTLRDISYDSYRDIHFKREAALWRDTPAPFQAEFMHTGYLFNAAVQIYILRNGVAQEYLYDPSMFYYGPLMETRGEPHHGAGFSGFRLLARLNSPAYHNEYAVFQGASYFRATGRNQVYGLSARGLAINCGQPSGEEFPAFRTFWLQEPARDDEAAIVYALLDSESVTGAYKFQLRPGRATIVEVDCALFCRKPVAHVGVAPLTSMFFFGQNQRRRFDDYRPEVHDSDGLAIWNGAGEWLWRPLLNPERAQFSAFGDRHPKGFGLMQRTRTFSQYQDLEARYDRRPSAWVEPLGDWGRGSVDLLELPTIDEANDNVVAFWRPENGFAPGRSYNYRYRIHWGQAAPVNNNLAWVASAQIGRSMSPKASLFVVDFLGTLSLGGDPLTVDLHASAGATFNTVLTPNPVTRGHRLSFDFDPGDCEIADIRGSLTCNGARVSEVWTHRWSA